MKRESSFREGVSGSEVFDPSQLSKAKKGVAVKVSELFQGLNFTESGLMLKEKMWRSAPIMSMTMLNNENKSKNRQENSGRTRTTSIKATKTLTFSTSTTPTLKEEKGDEGSRRLRPLVSLNPHVIDPGEILHRFFTMNKIEDQVFIVALIYLQRALYIEDELKLKHFHKVLAGCLLLAHKYLVDDQYWDFEDFGFLSGVNPDQLEKVETCVLRRVLRYDLYVSREEYEEVLGSLFMSEAF